MKRSASDRPGDWNVNPARADAARVADDATGPQQTPSARPRVPAGSRRGFGLALFLIAAGLLAAPFFYRWRSNESEGVDGHLRPEPRQTKLLNAAAGVRYVGSQQCAECHAGEYDSYLRTEHSRALQEVDPDAEPPDGQFTRGNTGRHYRVYRRDGQLRHREFVRTESGDKLVLEDHAVRYAMGSGHYSKTYLVEEDGFLLESPITWYASAGAWNLSPGYTNPEVGFARTVGLFCVNCHSGRVAAVHGSPHRLRIHEMAIGCEKCHGPGELHVAQQTAGTRPSDEDHSTIVHPGRLDRERQEAICAQCHLYGETTVEVRGREPGDFRPGLLLTDFRVSYQFSVGDKPMTVVGHVEQMRLSACYQASETLTCTTCHDPHGSPKPAERVGYYRAKCLACHGTTDCGLRPEERLLENKDDNCVVCHMPQSETEIPHFAFTHHRIGLPGGQQDEEDNTAVGTLVPINDVSHLSQLEQERCLALAYLNVARAEQRPDVRRRYAVLAEEKLKRLYAVGYIDPAVAISLAQISLKIEGNAARAFQLASQVWQLEQSQRIQRSDSAEILGRYHLSEGRPELALPLFEQLERLRRRGEDRYLLGVCRAQLSDLPGAIAAVKQAVAIHPSRPPWHEFLAQLYQQHGQPEQAAAQREQARRLRLALQSE